MPAEGTHIDTTDIPETLDAPAGAGPRRSLRNSVGASAGSLQAAFLGQRGDRRQTEARARLAILRRSAGYSPQSHPVAWQAVLDLLDPPLPDWEIGRGDAPSPSESAAFSAITLFALHMQSQSMPMHVPGRSFGSAMRVLRRNRDSASIKPRFDALLSARHDRSRLGHARSLVTLLRSEQIGFDYGQFTVDLRTLASSRHQGVLLRWGRDFSIPSKEERDAAAAKHAHSSAASSA